MWQLKEQLNKLKDMLQIYSRYRVNSKSDNRPVCLNDGEVLQPIFVTLEPTGSELEEMVGGNSVKLIKRGTDIFHCSKCDTYLVSRSDKSMETDFEKAVVRAVAPKLALKYSSSDYKVKQVESITSSLLIREVIQNNF
jgi:hypothetical protein